MPRIQEPLDDGEGGVRAGDPAGAGGRKLTSRDATFLGGALVVFVGSVLPLVSRTGPGNLWNAQNVFFLAIGILLPLLVAVLIVRSRLAPGRPVRIGTLTLGQFASVVSAMCAGYFFVLTVTTFSPGGVVGLLGAVLCCFATVFASSVPAFAAARARDDERDGLAGDRTPGGDPSGGDTSVRNVVEAKEISGAWKPLAPERTAPESAEVDSIVPVVPEPVDIVAHAELSGDDGPSGDAELSGDEWPSGDAARSERDPVDMPGFGTGQQPRVPQDSQDLQSPLTAVSAAAPSPVQDPAAERSSIEASLDAEDGSPYEAFWFAVSVPRVAVDEGTGAPSFRLAPGQWILALEDRGHEFLVQDVDGRRGLLRELEGIERG